MEAKVPLKHYYTKEPIIHGHIEDELTDDHLLADKTVYCDGCFYPDGTHKEMLNTFYNRNLQTWIETEFGNYCTICWRLTEVTETLEDNLKR